MLTSRLFQPYPGKNEARIGTTVKGTKKKGSLGYYGEKGKTIYFNYLAIARSFIVVQSVPPCSMFHVW